MMDPDLHSTHPANSAEVADMSPCYQCKHWTFEESSDTGIDFLLDSDDYLSSKQTPFLGNTQKNERFTELEKVNFQLESLNNNHINSDTTSSRDFSTSLIQHEHKDIHLDNTQGTIIDFDNSERDSPSSRVQHYEDDNMLETQDTIESLEILDSLLSLKRDTLKMPKLEGTVQNQVSNNIPGFSEFESDTSGSFTQDLYKDDVFFGGLYYDTLLDCQENMSTLDGYSPCPNNCYSPCQDNCRNPRNVEEAIFDVDDDICQEVAIEKCPEKNALISRKEKYQLNGEPSSVCASRIHSTDIVPPTVPMEISIQENPTSESAVWLDRHLPLSKTHWISVQDSFSDAQHISVKEELNHLAVTGEVDQKLYTPFKEENKLKESDQSNFSVHNSLETFSQIMKRDGAQEHTDHTIPCLLVPNKNSADNYCVQKTKGEENDRQTPPIAADVNDLQSLHRNIFIIQCAVPQNIPSSLRANKLQELILTFDQPQNHQFTESGDNTAVQGTDKSADTCTSLLSNNETCKRQTSHKSQQSTDQNCENLLTNEAAVPASSDDGLKSSSGSAAHHPASTVRVGKQGRFVSVPTEKVNRLMVRDLLSLSGNKTEVSMKEKTEEFRRDLCKMHEQRRKRLKIST